MRSRKIDGIAYKEVTWIPTQKAPSGQGYRVVGYINPQNMVDRVETWVEHPIFGDLHVETAYSNYQDFGALKAPTKISQKQAGMETFVVAISEVRANPPEIALRVAPLPAAGGRGGTTGGSLAPPAVASEKLADGVYRITGGYVALAVELRDYVVVLEGGQNEARGLATIAETRRVIPIEIEGDVAEFQYKNPHAWVYVVGEEPFGTRKAYAAEWTSTSQLERAGITKDTLHVGDNVRIWVSPNRNPSDNRVRLKRIERRSDGWRWGRNGRQTR